MKVKILAAAVMGISVSSISWALNPFVIKNIRIEGLQRTEPGTVFNYLPIKVGDTLDNKSAQKSIKSLFATGFFNDIRIETEGHDVIVEVDERPVVAQLNINGAKDLSSDQIKKALRSNGFSESYTYDPAVLDQAIQGLKSEYFSRGKYSVVIKRKITRLDRNRVAVDINISEGDTAKIKDIRIIGTKGFSESNLLDEFSLSTDSWFSWLSKDNQYSKQKLSGDLEKLRAYYENQGYLEFSIDSTQVAISPDKKYIFITINIHEGNKYTVGNIKLSGEMKTYEDELHNLLEIKKGDVFNREKINNSVTAMNYLIGSKGYAFSNVNVVPDINKDKHIVDFNMIVEPGRKTYVHKINITGNAKTRDEVIRRELRQMEGAPFDASKVKRSKERLDLLGYFDQVDVQTPAVQKSSDQVDVNFNVKERATGSISAGVGYAQGEGVQLSANLSQNNLFGSGKALSLGVSTGKVNKYANLSFTDPYFTPDGVSLGYDAYYRIYNPQNVDRSEYKTTTTGVDVRTGVPITEYDRINFSLGIENTKVVLFKDSPVRYENYVNEYGESNTNLLGKVGWSRDTRDNSIWPTRGAKMSANLESGLPGGDIEYYSLTHKQTWFFPLSKRFTLMLNGELGFANAYGKTKDLPFFQNYYLGGIGSVRGYDTGSIGPKDSNDEYLGGSRKAIANMELFFPMPGLRDSKSARLSIFADAGSLWDGKNRITNTSFSSELRYSFGAAITWISPVGPLKFSYAVPFNHKPEDKLERFQFQIGTVF